MRCIQFVFSPTGGTRKAAELIGERWPQKVSVDLTDASASFSNIAVEPEDLALIAVPSYSGRAPEAAAQRLAKVRGNGAYCVLICVYGNRAYDDTLVELSDLAEKRGFRVLAAIAAVAEHSIMRQYAAGRPDQKDAEVLRQFSREIAAKLEGSAPDTVPALPGSRPYRAAGSLPLVPKASGSCTSCGICAEHCPVQAIDPSNIRQTDSSRCIACMRCVAACPQSARSVSRLLVSAAALKMKKVCSVRKECELFL